MGGGELLLQLSIASRLVAVASSSLWTPDVDSHGQPRHLRLSSCVAPQVPPHPDHFPDQDVRKGRGFDLEGAGGIRRFVGVVGAQDEGVARAGDLLVSIRPPQTQR